MLVPTVTAAPAEVAVTRGPRGTTAIIMAPATRPRVTRLVQGSSPQAVSRLPRHVSHE